MKAGFRAVNLPSPAAPSGPELGARQTPISQKKKTPWILLLIQQNDHLHNFSLDFSIILYILYCYILSVKYTSEKKNCQPTTNHPPQQKQQTEIQKIYSNSGVIFKLAKEKCKWRSNASGQNLIRNELAFSDKEALGNLLTDLSLISHNSHCHYYRKQSILAKETDMEKRKSSA